MKEKIKTFLFSRPFFGRENKGLLMFTTLFGREWGGGGGGREKIKKNFLVSPVHDRLLGWVNETIDSIMT